MICGIYSWPGMGLTHAKSQIDISFSIALVISKRIILGIHFFILCQFEFQKGYFLPLALNFVQVEMGQLFMQVF